MKTWQLAQFNRATMQYPRDDERVAGFFERIDEINRLAESADGFVWRSDDDDEVVSENADADSPFVVANLSVWESIEALHHFVYRTNHSQLIARRKDWFERPVKAHQVLWWIAENHRPCVRDGIEKLDLLERIGPTPNAFTFKTVFAPDAAELANVTETSAAQK